MLEQVEKSMHSIVESLGDLYSLELFSMIPSGKRLRAKLILKIAGTNDESIKLASIVELIHAASLLHDDVIDDAHTRRSQPSLNALYGNKTAIMLGDILYSKGFHELTFFSPKISSSISNAVSLLSIGELQDVKLSTSFNDSIEKYFKMIYYKTASLIEASAYSAAYIANKNCDIYATYGKNLGLAFQVIDDILDITQDSSTLGKPSLQDFVEGKTTLPYLYMYQALNELDKDILRSLFAKKLNKDELDWMYQKLEETSAVKLSIAYAKKLGQDALKAIEKEKNIDPLKEIIIQMIERDF